MAYEFTETQKADIRRFMGYPPKGTDNNTIMSGLLFNESGALEYRLDKLTEEEGAIVVTYLGQLATLETSILDAADNLDTDQLAVITRNRSELADRSALFDNWRVRLCQFIGLPRGPHLKPGRGRNMVV